MKIGRNDPCYCGSGKKYKKCCGRNESVDPPIVRPIKPEPNINIVPSVVWKGYRHRVIWNRIHHRPINETFHDFLRNILLWTFGKKWHEEQVKIEHEKRHVVGKWLFALSEWQRSIIKDENKEIYEGHERWRGIESGEVKAFMQIAYDIYCLQIVNELPAFLVRRLRNNREFQGARYEVAVAAIIARAGFEITFLDKDMKQEKHCEFIAKHKLSNIEIGVEAKSRHRKGVLNEDGDYIANNEQGGNVWRLFREARTQKPIDIPFLIFIDMNIPPTPNIPTQDKVWVKDVMKMVNDCGLATPSKPDPFNASIFTNYAYYYTGNSGNAPSGEYCVCISNCPETTLMNKSVLNEIIDSVSRYGQIPDEV